MTQERTATEQPLAASDPELELLEEDLHRLRALRDEFTARALAGELGDVSLERVLRAWNESLGPMLRILRERRELLQRAAGKFDALVEEVLDDLMRRLREEGEPSERPQG